MDCEHLKPPCDYPTPFPGCGYEALFENLRRQAEADRKDGDKSDEDEDESEDEDEREDELAQNEDEEGDDPEDDEPETEITIEEL